jgi:hypothetical protein
MGQNHENWLAQQGQNRNIKGGFSCELLNAFLTPLVNVSLDARFQELAEVKFLFFLPGVKGLFKGLFLRESAGCGLREGVGEGGYGFWVAG